MSALASALMPWRREQPEGMKFVEWIEEEDGRLTLVAFAGDRLHEFAGVDFDQVARVGTVAGMSLLFANMDVSRHATITCDCRERCEDMSTRMGVRVAVRCAWCTPRRRRE